MLDLQTASCRTEDALHRYEQAVDLLLTLASAPIDPSCFYQALLSVRTRIQVLQDPVLQSRYRSLLHQAHVAQLSRSSLDLLAAVPLARRMVDLVEARALELDVAHVTLRSALGGKTLPIQQAEMRLALSTANPNTSFPGGGSRQRLGWSFSPKFQVLAGQTKTLTFQAQASPASGDYWNEVWVTFDEFADPVYTWPTARVRSVGTFIIETSDGRTSVYSEMWADPDGYWVYQWYMNR